MSSGIEPGIVKGNIAEIPDRPRLPSGNHEIFRLVLLQYKPHRFYVIASVPPVTLGIKIAEDELFLQPKLDPSYTISDLAGHELDTAKRRRVIDKDAI